MEQSSEELTSLLQRWSEGDDSIEEQLMQVLYPMLKNIARNQLSNDSSKNQLQTTELLNEAFIKLKQQQSVLWQNRSHFLAIAARVVRRLLVDYFRARHNQKRGGFEQHLTIDRYAHVIIGDKNVKIDWMDIHDLVEELQTIDHDSARIVELRFFGGLTVAETAEACHMPEHAVSKNWKFARSWLFSKLSGMNS